MRWQITPAEFQDVIRKLRFRYFKWDAFVTGSLNVVPESIVLSQEEHEEIVGLAERLAAILRDIERRAKACPEVLRRIGIPGPVAELIAREPDSPLQLARYDFFPRPEGGWAVSEFNEDVPGGFNEVIAAAELLGQHHPGLRFVDRFAERFLAALPDSGRIALMYATGYSEDMQHMLVLESLLQARGQPTVLCSPRHLGMWFGKPTVHGQRIAAAVRFYPGEWFALLENHRTWKRAADRLSMMNPLTRLISQSKAVFAVWDEPDMVSCTDRDWLHTLAPHTEYFSPQQESELVARPADWVIKANFGRMGENVVMGSLVTSDEWFRTIREVQGCPQDFVIQRCFSVAPMEFSDGPRFPAIGAFLINGRFAGYYSRIASQPFLTHQATYVPTVVDPQ